MTPGRFKNRQKFSGSPEQDIPAGPPADADTETDPGMPPETDDLAEVKGLIDTLPPDDIQQVCDYCEQKLTEGEPAEPPAGEGGMPSAVPAGGGELPPGLA